jgi:ER membrane protein complex subunit 3
MLQSGVMTNDLDVKWVSSLSWYFLNLFGLQSVFGFILGSENGKHFFLVQLPKLSWYLPAQILTIDDLAANQIAQQMGQMNPAAANPFQPGQDPDKLFQSEAENLEVMEHYCILDGIEERVLRSYGVL